ncbi:ABC transporter permease [Bordetella sputigena]|uniref:ABC transporter permease n=1 Tax=Bordetella sputigena TaxID=1416810 RepID=UPI0039F0D3DA
MSAFLSCLRALAGHWRRHPLQCASIVCGLWLATALWSGVQALNAQARQDYARAGEVLAGPAQAQWLPRREGDLDQDVYVRLRLDGWQVSPVLEGRLRFAGDPPLALRVLGIEPLSLPAGSAVGGQAITAFNLGDFIGQPGQTWAGPDTLRRLGMEEGDRPVTMDGERLPPLRLQAGLAPGILVMDIGHAQPLLHVQGRISRLLLPGKTAPAVPAAWADVLAPAPAAEDRDDLDRLAASFHLNLAALGMLAFIVGLFIVHASIGLALEQRRGLLRTLRALGVSLRMLVAALSVELGLFAVIGGVAGVASGYLLAGLLLGDMAASLRGLYGAEVAGRLSLPAWWWLAGVGMTLLGVLAAGVGSLVRAARLPLLAVARPQAWRGAQAAGQKRQLGVAGVMVLCAAACGAWGDSLASAFAMQAAILLAAALLLPSLLDGVLAWSARHVRGPLASWFIADSRQQLPALSLALMALLLALGASVGVGSMTDGFRKTFVTWLDQRLSADIYLNPRDSAQGVDALEWLRTQPGVRAALPQWRTTTHVRGWPVELQGVIDDPETRRQWPLLERTGDAWELLADGRGVMISEQLARRLHLGLGAGLALFGGGAAPPDDRAAAARGAAAGQPSFIVSAIYADYGNPRGHVLMQAGVLRQYLPQATVRSVNVYADPERLPSLRAALEQRYGADGMQVVDQASIKLWSTQVFERTFAATGALNTLTLGVAGIALFISLLTLSQSRLAQLAPLWALGVPRRKLAWLALGQVLTLSVLTVLCAMPLGVLLAWTLVAIVNVQAFGWRLPLYVFPSQLAGLAALGLLTSLLAAAWPVWQLRRRQPAELLRQFAHES